MLGILTNFGTFGKVAAFLKYSSLYSYILNQHIPKNDKRKKRAGSLGMFEFER